MKNQPTPWVSAILTSLYSQIVLWQKTQKLSKKELYPFGELSLLNSHEISQVLLSPQSKPDLFTLLMFNWAVIKTYPESSFIPFFVNLTGFVLYQGAQTLKAQQLDALLSEIKTTYPKSTPYFQALAAYTQKPQAKPLDVLNLEMKAIKKWDKAKPTPSRLFWLLFFPDMASFERYFGLDILPREQVYAFWHHFLPFADVPKLPAYFQSLARFLKPGDFTPPSSRSALPFFTLLLNRLYTNLHESHLLAQTLDQQEPLKAVLPADYALPLQVWQSIAELFALKSKLQQELTLKPLTQMQDVDKFLNFAFKQMAKSSLKGAFVCGFFRSDPITAKQTTLAYSDLLHPEGQASTLKAYGYRAKQWQSLAPEAHPASLYAPLFQNLPLSTEVFAQNAFTSLWFEDGFWSFSLLLSWLSAQKQTSGHCLQPDKPLVLPSLGTGPESELLIPDYTSLVNELLAFFEITPQGEQITARLQSFLDYCDRLCFYPQRNLRQIEMPYLPLVRTFQAYLERYFIPKPTSAEFLKVLNKIYQYLKKHPVPLLSPLVKFLTFQHMRNLGGDPRDPNPTPIPHHLFIHPLISEEIKPGHSMPVALLLGQFTLAPELAHWPFAAAMLDEWLKPLIPLVQTPLMQNLFMKQLQDQQEKTEALNRSKQKLATYQNLSPRIEKLIELEKSLRNESQFIRMQLLPPEITAFGIYDWPAFGQLFKDGALLQRPDGSLYPFKGLHSLKSVDANTLDQYGEYLKDLLNQAENLESSFPYLLMQTWQANKDRSVLKARQFFALLKLLSYDSGDPQKPLYWCQVLYTLLGIGRQESKPPITLQKQDSAGEIQTLDMHPNQAPNPLLLQLLDQIDPQITNLKDTGQSCFQIPHAHALKPVEFLAALSRLIYQELQPDEPGWVSLKSLEATLYAPSLSPGKTHALRLRIHCHHLFPDLDVLENSKADHYSSMRDVLATLAKGVGVKHFERREGEPTDTTAPFVIFSDHNTRQTHIQILLAPVSKMPDSKSNKSIDDEVNAEDELDISY